jgi:hypothetical protein
VALSVLSRVKIEPGSPAAQKRAEIASQWAGVVEHHKGVREPGCVLLGHKVDDVKDWAKVKIPRPSDLFWKPQSGTTTKPAGGN